MSMKKLSHRKRLEASGKVVNTPPIRVGGDVVDIFVDHGITHLVPPPGRKKKLESSAGISPRVYAPTDPSSVLGQVTKALGWERQAQDRLWAATVISKSEEGTRCHTSYIGHHRLEALAEMDKEDVPRALAIEGMTEWNNYSKLFLEKRLELGI